MTLEITPLTSKTNATGVNKFSKSTQRDVKLGKMELKSGISHANWPVVILRLGVSGNFFCLNLFHAAMRNGSDNPFQVLMRKLIVQFFLRRSGNIFNPKLKGFALTGHKILKQLPRVVA